MTLRLIYFQCRDSLKYESRYHNCPVVSLFFIDIAFVLYYSNYNMPYLLGDIFIGDFPITQNFGARPEIYSTRYNLKGHNGTDFGCPSLTLILAAQDGIVTEVGFDSAGYGNYVKIKHTDYLTLYGHLNDTGVKQNDHVVTGQLIGHSDNTGFSDAPHLHFGVAPCDANGIKTQADNGFSGYIDPMGGDCQWDIKNLTQPIQPQDRTSPPIDVQPEELSIKTAQANNFRSAVSYGLQNGFGVFLSNHGESIDFINNPGDVDAGRKFNEWVSSLIQNIVQLQDSNSKLSTNDTQQIDQTISQLPTDKKASILSSLITSVKGFIFK